MSPEDEEEYHQRLYRSRDEESFSDRVKNQMENTCPECGRVFDMLEQLDADEWFNGHDCEVDS